MRQQVITDLIPCTDVLMFLSGVLFSREPCSPSGAMWSWALVTVLGTAEPSPSVLGKKDTAAECKACGSAVCCLSLSRKSAFHFQEIPNMLLEVEPNGPFFVPLFSSSFPQNWWQLSSKIKRTRKGLFHLNAGDSSLIQGGQGEIGLLQILAMVTWLQCSDYLVQRQENDKNPSHRQRFVWQTAQSKIPMDFSCQQILSHKFGIWMNSHSDRFLTF